MDPQRIKRHEARLIRFEIWFYVIRRLSNGLAFLMVVAVVGLFLGYSGKNDVGEMISHGISGVIFLKLIASNAHARILHIESIRYHQGNS